MFGEFLIVIFGTFPMKMSLGNLMRIYLIFGVFPMRYFPCAWECEIFGVFLMSMSNFWHISHVYAIQRMDMREISILMLYIICCEILFSQKK